MTEKLRPETVAAQAAHALDAQTGAIVPPIHLATTYARDEHYQPMGPVYSRDENPTPVAAEKVLAALDGGADAMLFASGMAAATAVFRAGLAPGDHVVAPVRGYFAMRGWIERFCARWKVDVTFADPDAIAGALRPTTKLVWVESPANPTWEIADIAGVAAKAHAVGARVAVDATAATPVFVRPIELGADLVMHSATKYLAGHSDVLAGALITAKADAAWAELRALRHDEGAVIGPFEAYLVLRGLRTLFPRVERATTTAKVLAERLAKVPGVTVLYPGYSGMLSIRVAGGAAAALGVANRLTVWVRATSLGGVESLVEHRASVEGPTTPTPPDLLRLSVGLEHADDLWADLERALAGR